MKLRAITAAALAAIAGHAAAADLDSAGIISGPLGNPFYVSLAAGAEAGVKKINPSADVTVASYENDLNKEFDLIDTFIAQGKKLIILVAADPDGLTPAIKRAQAAGVIVVGMDAAANAADANVVTDNFQGGQLVCQYMGDKLGGKGNVVLINGPQVQGVIDRVNGCKSSLEKFRGIKIVADQQADSSREQGFAVMQTLMQQNTDINGVFAISDPMAIGAALAAQQANAKGLTIVGFDGSPEIVATLKADTMVMASASQDPYGLGLKAAEIGFAILNGKKPAEARIKAPTGLVSRENVGDYAGWKN
ncbi:substrate-binding domain-containing protein [Sinorhizobium meliloti]|nr:substrate-binding domain-containing protein [Sinorhizobium meliloti]MDX0376332.1 substrate-binding domain-containing protein [Sinorhizobium meliloti]